MNTETTTAEQIMAFDKREKFSMDQWQHSSVDASPLVLCESMSMKFHICCNELIEAINHNASKEKLKQILKKSIAGFSRKDYDTEEGEFICSLFYELASILHIEINHELSNWLYGGLATFLHKIGKYLFPGKVVETVRQPCRSCSKELETIILKKQQNFSDISWLAGKCNYCGELNLITIRSDVKEFTTGNYKCVETFQQAHYTYDQALLRVEQIKYFRRDLD